MKREVASLDKLVILGEVTACVGDGTMEVSKACSGTRGSAVN